MKKILLIFILLMSANVHAISYRSFEIIIDEVDVCISESRDMQKHKYYYVEKAIAVVRYLEDIKQLDVSRDQIRSIVIEICKGK